MFVPCRPLVSICSKTSSVVFKLSRSQVRDEQTNEWQTDNIMPLTSLEWQGIKWMMHH